MNDLEYLLSFGRLGDFGRFRSARPIRCRRGDRAVVVSSRGLEIGEVLQPAAARHAHFLPNTTVGQLLRLASDEDDSTEKAMAQKARGLFDRGAALRVELGLPLDLIDTEVLLDGKHGVVHVLRRSDCDVRPFVSSLSREFDLHLRLEDLTRSEVSVKEEEHASCGSGGSCGTGGGCGSCGSGGGCGSCAVPTLAVHAHHVPDRTPLL